MPLKKANKESDRKKGTESTVSREIIRLQKELQKYKKECKLLTSELKRQQETFSGIRKQFHELSTVIDKFFASGYFILSTDGVILEVNLQGAKMLGKKPTQLSGKFFSKFIETGKQEIFRDFFQKIIKTGERAECEVRLITKGKVLPVRVSGVSPGTSGNRYILVNDISTLKQIESRSNLNDRLYKTFISKLIDGYIYIDMEGKVIDSNEAYREMTGYSQEELSKQKYTDRTPAKWLALEHKILQEQILKKGYSSIYEKECIKKDGTIIPVELRVMLVKNEKGENTGLWGIMRDLTDRNKVRDQLIENEYWLKEAQRIGMLGSYTVEANKDRFYSSETLDNILGIDDNAEKNTELWYRIVAPEYREEITEYYRDLVKSKNRVFNKEYEIIRLNDQERRWVWEYANLGFDEQGNPGKTFGIIQDITDRKKADEIILRSEIEYKETLNSIPDWIMVVSSDLRLINMNSSFRETCLQQGLSPDLLGKHISGLIPFFSTIILEAIEHVFHCATPIILNETVDLLEETLLTEIRIIPMIRNKIVDKVIIVFRDKSREKEVADLRARNMEQKEVLLREIHHRVKNNLAIVISLLNFQLRRNSDLILNRIIRDVMIQIRSMALIHEHLYFSETLDKIPLASYIKSLLSNMAGFYPDSRIQLVSNLDPIDIKIEKALPVGLIINELLTNASKYAFPGYESGQISVELKSEEENWVSLTVSDNGIGLPESFSMETEESLGLFIIGIQVKQLEGTIEIIRASGTTFVIRFRNILDD